VGFAQLRRLVTTTAWPAESTPSSRSAILSQRCKHASEIPKSFAMEASPLAGHGDHVATELFGKCFRHGKHPFTAR
jgi:hypothetical protein